MRNLLSLRFLSKKYSPTNSHSFRPFHSLSKIKTKTTHFTTPHIPSSFSGFQYGFLSRFVLCKNIVECAHHFKINPLNKYLGSRVGYFTTHFSKLKKNKVSKPSSSTQPHQPLRPRSSYFGEISTENVVYGLMFANAAIFTLWRVLPRDFMIKNFTISVDNLNSGRIHTLLSCAFSHVSMGHLSSNMITLYCFGHSIGRLFGAEFLVMLYVAGAIGGSACYMLHHAYLVNPFKEQGTSSKGPPKAPGLGANGAVNAILLLDICLFPRKTIYFDFFIPVPAILLGTFLVGMDLLRIAKGDPHRSGSAHLGGAITAVVACLGIRR